MLCSAFDEIAVKRELADERIDLSQAQRELQIAFEIPAYEAVVAHSALQGHGQASSVEAVPYFFPSASTPRMRSPWRR